MANWLPLSLLFGVVLVTSYTSMGLLALWAATSRRHWLLRSTVVLVVLAPLLLIPAYEPWIVFALQACTVTAGVQLWRWRAARRHVRESPSENCDVPKRRFRFSLATLLALVPLVAVLTVIGTRIVANLPEQNTEAWTTIVLNGLCSGCAVLLGAWMAAGKRKRIVWPAALLLCLGLAGVMAAFDWLFVSGTVSSGDWPPNPQTLALVISAGVLSRLDLILPWFGVVPAVALGAWMMTSLWSARPTTAAATAEPTGDIPSHRCRCRTAARCIFAAVFFVLACPSALVVWRLLHLPPLPNVTIPEPNGLDDIVAAGNEFAKSPILIAAADPKSTEELAAEIAKYAGAYQRLRQGLSRDVGPEFWTHEEDLADVYNASVNNLMRMRWAARALMREAELAQQQNRHGDAAKIALENVRLGQAIVRDALMIDYLMGIVVESIGDQSLYQSLRHLNAEQCRETIAALVQVDRHREPVDEVWRRDRIWEEHAYGWFYRLWLMLSDVLPQKDFGIESQMHARQQALTRLLILELALRTFQLEHGTPPDRLEQLTPEFLDELPRDPFASNGKSLRYIRSEEGCVVYSIGADCKDDGGRPLVRDENGWTNPYGDGDLRLDAYFAPDEPAEDVAAADNDGQ